MEILNKTHNKTSRETFVYNCFHTVEVYNTNNLVRFKYCLYCTRIMQWKRFSSIAILEMHSNEETNRVRSMSGFTPLNIYYEE